MEEKNNIPPETRSQQHEQKNEIPEGELGSKDKPYTAYAVNIETIINNSRILGGKWGNDKTRAYYDFQGNIYSIDWDYNTRLEQGTGDEEKDKALRKRMEQFVRDTKEHNENPAPAAQPLRRQTQGSLVDMVSRKLAGVRNALQGLAAGKERSPSSSQGGQQPSSEKQRSK